MTTIEAIRHVATHHHRVTAWAGGFVTWNLGMAVETATNNDGLGVFTQLGVAGLIVIALLYMLRRSDVRDAERIKDLKAQIAAERRRAEHAEEENRRLAQHLED